LTKKQGFSEDDYQKKEKEFGEDKMREVEKFISLRILDALWVDHLETMDYIRDSVRLRAYGQRDPLVEYKQEAHKAFQDLLSTFETTLANSIFRVSVLQKETPVFSREPSSLANSRPPSQKLKKKPGRNDPCPCGKINPQTGKPMKYKKCCWPKYG